MTRRIVVAVVMVALAAPGFAVAVSGLRLRPASAAANLSVRVDGDRLVDGSGQPLRLIGVDRSGTEYACAQGWGIFDGPSDAASVAAMAAWRINAVRVPLNEDCWLGINGVPTAYAGANYQRAVATYVATLHAAGLIAILDLHWNAPGTQLAAGQQVMADADHSPAFWASVAAAFTSDPAVVFDLYNEPHDIPWSCWRDGCTAPGGWQVAGMRSLVAAVRSAGATQPVLAGGLNWGGDLSQWLAYAPADSQLAASVHIYNFSQCNTATCWTNTIAPVAEHVPVVTGEIGENDCAGGFVDQYMNWADSTGVSYLAWSWNTASCGGGPALISSYSGTATAFGAVVQSHLAGLAVPQQGYVLDGFGGVDGFGVSGAAVAPPATTSDSWPGWNIARAAAHLDGGGGYVLDGWGGVHPFAAAGRAMPPAATTSDYWMEWDIARGIALLPDGSGGYVLDGWGGVHPFAIGSNPMPAPVTLSASWPGWDIARALAMLPDSSGGYVVDGWGGIHPFATGTHGMPPAVSSSAYWPQQDVARGITLTRDGTAGYIVRNNGALASFAPAGAAQPPTAASLVLAAGAEGRGVFLTP